MTQNRIERRGFLKGLCAVAPMIWNSKVFALRAASRISQVSTRPALPGGGVRLNIRDFGASAEGTSKNTPRIQEALDRCAALGGGEVLVPAGTYLTGSIALRSNTVLRLEKDAVLKGSGDFADYPVTQVRWEGKWIQGHVGLVYAMDANNVGIVGPGKIEGDPSLGGRPTKQNPLRHPALIEFIRCRQLHLEGFSTSYAHMWSVHPADCEDILIRGLTIRSTGGNGDGIDIDSSRRVWIDHCDISTGDDCISLKSGRGSEAWAIQHDTEDVRITNCTFADSIFACIGIGSETSAGIRNVSIESCRFTRAQTFAIYIKSRVGRGAFIEDIVAKDLDVAGTVGGFLRINLLSSGIQDEVPIAGLEGIPRAGGYRFSNIRVQECPVLVDATSISPDRPLNGLSLTNISGTCAKGILIANTKQADIRNVHVTGYAGPLVQIHNVTGKGLAGAGQIDGPKLPAAVTTSSAPYVLR